MLKNLRKKRKLVLLLLALLILLGLTFGYRHHNKDEQKASASTKSPAINLSPPTQQDKNQVDQHKAELPSSNSQSSDQSNNSTSSGQITVIIAHADKNSINAYVSGVFENGGTCTAMFTQGATSITRSSNGFANVSYTQCSPITPNLPNSNGWSVVVKYNSADAQGSSQPQSF